MIKFNNGYLYISSKFDGFKNQLVFYKDASFAYSVFYIEMLQEFLEEL